MWCSKNVPLTPMRSGLLANQTAVSAPSDRLQLPYCSRSRFASAAVGGGGKVIGATSLSMLEMAPVGTSAHHNAAAGCPEQAAVLELLEPTAIGVDLAGHRIAETALLPTH